MTTTEKLTHLNALREANGKPPLKAWKSSGEKLDAAIEAETAPVTAPETVTETTVDPLDLPPTTETVVVPEAPKSERGAIGRLVNELLVDTDLGYAEIVERVREAYPMAKTTARSIASVAADLRRDGIDVKSRRKVAAPKVAKA